MHLLSLLVAAALLCAAHSIKFNTDIDGCMAHVQGILGGESDARVKTAVDTIIAGTKAGDVHVEHKTQKSLP
ncbi:hypothetical protein PRIPAC_77754 [Pristionchus pacificus]|uniref:Uncharacterized protein n=1 Tax=Pristionchus pacificus TaxID=54126 RepID=A0A2A6CJV8_PRIPA|nr:hypothetical protein PRIPAC_77754 [Pristionchus pacificus]|eukprot:PDM78367.1 hypothetical protein PRIPAC_30946 [Pristionchus pacificus]